MAIFLLSMPVYSATPRAILDIQKKPSPGETLIWSPIFQASWDKLLKTHKTPLKKTVPPNKLITQLTHFQWDEQSVMPQDAYASFAGTSTPEFLKHIETEIKKQFSIQIKPLKPAKHPATFTLYNILFYNLKFNQPFYLAKKKPLLFKDSLHLTHAVQFFGTKGNLSKNYANFVRVLDYKNKGKSFILDIATKETDETIIIYRPNHAVSFATAINTIKKARRHPLKGAVGTLTDGNLHKKDTLKIPTIHLNTKTVFTDKLKGLLFFDGDSQPRRISLAYQIALFDLSEKGAHIRVETRLDESPFGPSPPPRPLIDVPRQFICDHPFFVFAWKKKAELPYFSAWIDGVESLHPFPSTKKH